ncbi:MAG: FAD-dependent oxidoreductase [Candidatus Brocadiae bacterium]|nr:FAD-dependent oxidoreductase [Candidatus Brocadiia bacterium]
MANTRIVVIGGSAAGPKAAAKARRIDPHAEITIIQKEADLSMASCGYPYYVGGFFDDRRMLICTPTGVVRDPNFFLNAKGITARTRTEALSIDREARTVACKNLDTGESQTLPYEKLVIATGSSPFIPPVPGIELEGITTLQSMRDADYLRQVRDEGKVKNAVVVGGGLIGVETCEALHLAGIQVTIVEMLPQIVTFLDWELAKLVENHINSNGARVITGNALTEFVGKDGTVTGARLADGTEIPCQLAVVAVGVRPNTRLAADAGLDVGRGIVVNPQMQTSDPDIYAIGDCVEIPHRITGKSVLAPFGDLANLEGRVAGQNAALGDGATFPGTFQTGVCKVFDYVVGSTGLSETAARKQGYDDIVCAEFAGLDKPPFMGGKLLVIKMVADATTGKLLGVQCVGPGDASKRIAIAAMALHGGLTVTDLVNADLPYAPPFSPALDPLITAAHVLENKMLGRMKGITPIEVKAKLDAGERPLLLDCRGPDEYDAMRLGIGETLIPLGALRSRLDEMPGDKDAEIICYCKISLRGYEAACLLAGQGYTNAKVLEGGIMAWPYPRER